MEVSCAHSMAQSSPEGQQGWEDIRQRRKIFVTLENILGIWYHEHAHTPNPFHPLSTLHFKTLDRNVFCIYIPENLINSLCKLVEDNHVSVHMFSVLLPYWIQPLCQWKSWDEGTGKYLSSSSPIKDTVLGKCMCITDTQAKGQGHQQQIFELINFLGLLFFFLRSLPAELVHVSSALATKHPTLSHGLAHLHLARGHMQDSSELASSPQARPWTAVKSGRTQPLWMVLLLNLLLGMGPHLSSATQENPW